MNKKLNIFLLLTSFLCISGCKNNTTSTSINNESSNEVSLTNEETSLIENSSSELLSSSTIEESSLVEESSSVEEISSEEESSSHEKRPVVDIGPQDPFKTAIFADVQLTAKERATNIAPNAGLTCNAFVALYNHFKLCKEQNVDVIFMGGDVVNNSIDQYYLNYESVLKSVYGEDETTYPEIIWNMGNHEWWDANENECNEAVKNFRKYARIETDNLVKQSEITYYLDSEVKVPTYYKVVKGIPFLVVSGENSQGKISGKMKSEITSWLEEIEQLPSVVAGGPIYVSYHYPLHTTLTHGTGVGKYSHNLEELLEKHPQAIVFTGDTHFSAVNERAINQVNYTDINIGSSSYSRMDPLSATADAASGYYNMKKAGSVTKDIILGNNNYQYEYTPTILLSNINEDRSLTIDRYFSTSDPESPIHINKTWEIDRYSDIDNFKYTNDRIKNKEMALECYNKEGLDWDESAKVKFGVADNKMTVVIPDVKDYHYCEHMKIEVTSNTNESKVYDVVTNYYLYKEYSQNIPYVLDNLPSGDSYSIKVTAYDYFDNPSTNYLTSNENDPSVCFDMLEYHLTDTYSDISNRVYIEDSYSGNTSIEYFYQGVMKYNFGAILHKVYSKGDKTIEKYISLKESTGANVTLTITVKNLTNYELTLGLATINGAGKWMSDFGNETRQKVPANSDWVTLTWNLTDLYGITGLDEMEMVELKASSIPAYDPVNGYQMHFLLDNIDIYSN